MCPSKSYVKPSLAIALNRCIAFGREFSLASNLMVIT
jgi:hypothetical protein